jgi:hypothetical protein
MPAIGATPNAGSIASDPIFMIGLYVLQLPA